MWIFAVVIYMFSSLSETKANNKRLSEIVDCSPEIQYQICQSHDIHNGTLQTSESSSVGSTYQNHGTHVDHITKKSRGSHLKLGSFCRCSPVLWAAVASVHLQPPPLCSLPASLREYPWWLWNSPPERAGFVVGRPKWHGKNRNLEVFQKCKNLDVFPGIWIIIWIVIWDLLLNLCVLWYLGAQWRCCKVQLPSFDLDDGRPLILSHGLLLPVEIS